MYIILVCLMFLIYIVKYTQKFIITNKKKTTFLLNSFLQVNANCKKNWLIIFKTDFKALEILNK